MTEKELHTRAYMRQMERDCLPPEHQRDLDNAIHGPATHVLNEVLGILYATIEPRPTQNPQTFEDIGKPV